MINIIIQTTLVIAITAAVAALNLYPLQITSNTIHME